MPLTNEDIKKVEKAFDPRFKAIDFRFQEIDARFQAQDDKLALMDGKLDGLIRTSDEFLRNRPSA